MAAWSAWAWVSMGRRVVIGRTLIMGRLSASAPTASPSAAPPAPAATSETRLPAARNTAPASAHPATRFDVARSERVEHQLPEARPRRHDLDDERPAQQACRARGRRWRRPTSATGRSACTQMARRRDTPRAAAAATYGRVTASAIACDWRRSSEAAIGIASARVGSGRCQARSAEPRRATRRRRPRPIPCRQSATSAYVRPESTRTSERTSDGTESATVDATRMTAAPTPRRGCPRRRRAAGRPAWRAASAVSASTAVWPARSRTSSADRPAVHQRGAEIETGRRGRASRGSARESGGRGRAGRARGRSSRRWRRCRRAPTRSRPGAARVSRNPPDETRTMSSNGEGEPPRQVPREAAHRAAGPPVAGRTASVSGFHSTIGRMTDGVAFSTRALVAT